MIIESIKWISSEAEEAEVEISDGHFKCVVFSQPCSAKVGQQLTEPLHVFSIKNAMISDKFLLGIWSTNNEKLERKVVAKIVDIKNQIIAVGDICMIIDDLLPGGLENGNVIEFKCARVDLW
ncbi:hypothetical protein [Pseudomonas sp. GL-B-19]|uniref:hypothetical protein n=1 Tax=Pseudomonas sp. GL-B-19 TaxID=2832393 RepID=UPI001CC08518|nr:hypothetical protein [Pseudomonas sp. GL-B-19]